jgi:hypothetical protein
MTALFSPLKVDPERKIAKAKKAEKAGLLMPAFIGLCITGGLYACASNAARQFTWWGFFGAAGSGAIACTLSRAVANQPGSSETLRALLISTDKMTEVAASLDESMLTTHAKLDRQQEGLALTGESMARLQSSLAQSSQSIDQFSRGLYQMASGYAPVPQPSPVYDHPQSDPYQTPVETASQGLQFDPEDEWS